MANVKVAPVTPEGPSGATSGAGAQAGPTGEVTKENVWREFAKGQNWFSNLRIAHDGGFGEVHVLFTKDRFVWALLTIGFLVMNMWVLVYPNIDALATQPWLVKIEVRRGYLINYVLQSIFDEGVNPRILLAILELLLLLVLICRASIFFYNTFSSDPAHRWHAISSGLWLVVPHLTTFSSMRLLNFVAPSVMLPALTNEITAATRRGFNRYGIDLIRFAILRALCAIVGFEAFMVKFLDTADKVMHNADTGWNSILLSVAFLNQMLGIVQVTPLVQQRLFIYIFGGEDSFVSDRELAIQHVWCARLTKHIWEEAVNKHRPAVLWFLAVMLAYTDMDFQRLTLNEKGKPRTQDACCGPGEGAEEFGGDDWVLKAA